MILVTGAAGKTGRAVLRALAARGEEVCALVHRPGQIRPVEKLGAQKVVAGDFLDPAAMHQVARGSRAVYHIPPNVSPDEVAIAESVIASALDAGVKRLVYHSVLHPQTEEMPHHWQKMRVEELIFKSGLDFTILQPTAYMQNLLAHREKILTECAYPVPYGAETRLSMIDLVDVAEAAAIVLTEAGHTGAIYELVGTRPLTQTEVVEELGRSLGKRIQLQIVPLRTWEEEARAGGVGDNQVRTLVRMFQYYQRYGFVGNSRVLEWLLGRAPTGFSEFIERELCIRS